jgi:DNA primase
VPGNHGCRASNGPRNLSLREALIVKALLTHPGLIDDWAEEIAGLDLSAKVARSLRDAVLQVHAESAPLDREGVATHLERLGLGPSVERIDRLVGNLGDPLVKSQSDDRAVQAGWRHVLEMQQRAGLEDALKEAESAFHVDGSEEAFERIRDLQKRIQQAVHRPD